MAVTFTQVFYHPKLLFPVLELRPTRIFPTSLKSSRTKVKSQRSCGATTR